MTHDHDALVALESELAKLRAEVARLRATPIANPALVAAYRRARDHAAQLRNENELAATSINAQRAVGTVSGIPTTPHAVIDAVTEWKKAAIALAEAVSRCP